MHSIDARAEGESEQRLYTLNAWAETPFFSDRERAALAWTEAVTNVSQTHVPDEVFEEVKKHFSEKEIVDLTLALAMLLWSKYIDSYHPFPPRTEYDPKGFYRDLADLHVGWNNMLQQGMRINLPDDRVADMARFALIREMMTRVADFPKYGAVDKDYAGSEHDGFPDTFTVATSAMNSIAAYCIAHFLEGSLQSSLRIHLGANFFGFAGSGLQPFCEGATILLCYWLILLWMYRRKLFLKI